MGKNKEVITGIPGSSQSKDLFIKKLASSNVLELTWAPSSCIMLDATAYFLINKSLDYEDPDVAVSTFLSTSQVVVTMHPLPV